MNQPMITTDATNSELLQPEAIREQCDQWLTGYFEENIKEAGVLDEGYEALWQAAATSTLGGGKRLRPYFLKLSYLACGGRESEATTSIAAACELLHQCLLIHDDVIDRDYIRHGQPNVAGQLRSRYETLDSDTDHFADSGAILSGDLLLSDVYMIISDSSFSSSIKQRLFKEVRKAIYEVAAGELMDVEAVIREIHESDPIKVATYKTASYSFILPLVGGAILAGASQETIELVRQLGLNLGIAYQIQDDILGLFGDESKTGKSNLGDLREGKHTLLVQFALNTADPDSRQRISAALGNKNLTQSEADTVRNIIRSCGAYDRTQGELNRYTMLATGTLDDLSFDANYKLAFTRIIDKLLVRDV